jgi:hypothetical protein
MPVATMTPSTPRASKSERISVIAAIHFFTPVNNSAIWHFVKLGDYLEMNLRAGVTFDALSPGSSKHSFRYY